MKILQKSGLYETLYCLVVCMHAILCVLNISDALYGGCTVLSRQNNVFIGSM